MSAIYKDGSWYGKSGGGGSTITVDNELSTTSENPVQNKVITNSLSEKTVSQELTQAQYDALTPAQQNDGTVYYVTDAEPDDKVASCGFTPVGTIISVMGTSAPANYLVCDGTVYNISSYPELAKYFKDQFGSENKFGGDGTTTFAVPDLQGEFLRGAGTNSHTNGGSGGEVGNHQHPTLIPNVYANASGNTLVARKTQTSNADAAQYYDVGINSTKYSTGSVTYNGSASSYIAVYTTRPTNTSVLYCIASRNIYVDAKYDYSTDEKVIGTWIDGKPLYQKTFTGTLSLNNDQMNVAHGISNISSCIFREGYVAAGGSNDEFTPLGFANTGSAVANAYVDKTNICFRCSSSYYNGKPYYITLRYTKTTD